MSGAAPVIVYAPAVTPRLRYVLDWLLGEQLGFTYELTTNREEAIAAKHCIAYSHLPGKFSVHNAGLLFESGIRLQAVTGGAWKGRYALFPGGDDCTIPFDLFSSIFYLLSRYEEYTELAKDKHGRYPSSASVLSRDGVLERPVIDEWVEYLRGLLEQEWRMKLRRPPFRFRPTYDIDIAWSYRHKGAKRFLGAALSELISGSLAAFTNRMKVAAGILPDPYDAFAWMSNLHRHHPLRPRYFILAALATTAFDKNIHPHHPAMQQLIKALQEEGPTGMHPSYFTHQNGGMLAAEKAALEQTASVSISASRQHFIRLHFPETPRALIAAGIEDDYSMGYGTALGFRAGTSHSFCWYDVEQEAAMALRMHPFCFMDTTAHFDLGLDVAGAFSRLRQMTDELQACSGVLCTVFHNFSLGTDPQWAGWQDAYATFYADAAGGMQMAGSIGAR